MIRDFLKSNIFSKVTYTVGSIYLSCLLVNALFMSFFIKAFPSCHYEGEFIGYVDCGRGFFSRIAEILFNYTSPKMFFDVFLIGYFFLASILELKISSIFLLLVILSFAFLVFCGVSFISQSIKKLTSGNLRIYSFISLLSLMILPSLMVFGWKLYLIPPPSSERILHVNFWHGEFSVPRKYLENWSITEVKKPDKEPSNFEAILSRYLKTPYIVFKVPIDVGIVNQAITVRVSPYYNILNEDFLDRQRVKYLDSQLGRTTWPNIKLYNKSSDWQNWEIYSISEISQGQDPDIYVMRDQTSPSRIIHILECTSMKLCGKELPNGVFSMPRCEGPEQCQNCLRKCADMSLGTPDYNISYFFDKNLLSEHENIDRQIRAFVRSFYTAHHK